MIETPLAITVFFSSAAWTIPSIWKVQTHCLWQLACQFTQLICKWCIMCLLVVLPKYDCIWLTHTRMLFSSSIVWAMWFHQNVMCRYCMCWQYICILSSYYICDICTMLLSKTCKFYSELCWLDDNVWWFTFHLCVQYLSLSYEKCKINEITSILPFVVH